MRLMSQVRLLAWVAYRLKKNESWPEKKKERSACDGLFGAP
jgi:hypothetical protein